MVQLFSMEDKTIIGIFCIGCLLILEMWALHLGYNGALFFPVVAIMASLAGAELKEDFLDKWTKIKKNC